MASQVECMCAAVISAAAVILVGALLCQPQPQATSFQVVSGTFRLRPRVASASRPLPNLNSRDSPYVISSPQQNSPSETYQHTRYVGHAALQSLLPPLAFVCTFLVALTFGTRQQTPSVACTSMSGQRTTRRSMRLNAGFFEKLFAPPRYEEDDTPEGETAVVADDDAEMAALRRHVLPGTFISDKPLKLAYDAERDGWYSTVFHQKVDNLGSAVLVGKTIEGVLFGAYNGVGWASTEVYRDTRNAFLFHFPSGKIDDSVEILPRLEGLPSIFDSGSQGPAFGADGLRIPLGKQVYTRSKLRAKLTEEEEQFEMGMSRRASSSLGTYYAGREDGMPSLFGEDTRTELTELRIYVAK